MAVFGMRGTGNFTQISRTVMRLSATPDRHDGQQDELLFGARYYKCAHCGTRYESLPGYKGAMKCRACGSNEIGEE
jgi:hypothetical protein